MIKRKAQSTLEYILVLIAVLLALIAATFNSGSPLRQGMANYLDGVGNTIGRITSQ